MSRYDDLFDDPHKRHSVFADKAALDPLREPPTLVARESQERQLAEILDGVHDGYLPTTVSIYGPPGTGKTSLTRRLCQEFATRTESLAVEYVNLKDCRTIFSAANEIHQALTGEQRGAYEGLDGVFEGIWTALETYPTWTVLLLDEIDHIRYDTNHDPNDFLYRLLRGDGKLQRDLNLSVWLLSNELLDVDLKVDSRVESAMSGQEVFFPPYNQEELRGIIEPRLERAFAPGCVTPAAVDAGVQAAAERWGDARKLLRLVRQAGEHANEHSESMVTEECIAACLEATEEEAVIAKLQSLPLRHLVVLTASVARTDHTGNTIQPVRVNQIYETLQTSAVSERFQFGERTVQQIVNDLETMGLVTTWLESRGATGRSKLVETTFAPEWVHTAQAEVAADLTSEGDPPS